MYSEVTICNLAGRGTSLIAFQFFRVVIVGSCLDIQLISAFQMQDVGTSEC